MAAGNNVTVIGNVTRDPELRFTASGVAMAKFGIAVNRRWQNRQTNEWEEEASFFNVTAWRELGENIANSLTKGSRVIVSGALRQHSWETDNGEKRSSVEITADEVGPSLRWATASVERNPRRDEGGFGGAGGAAPQAAPAAAGGGGMPEEQPWEDEPAF